MDSTPIRDWHRMLGITLTDLLSDRSWGVVLEKELALRRQLLDVLIVARPDLATPVGLRTDDLPDGLHALRGHNLLTFKSHHEALDVLAIEELIGHSVTYRKLITAEGDAPADADLALLAVSVRYPRGLAAQIPLHATDRAGVFDILWGTRQIRVIVLEEVALLPRNAPWTLFSQRAERFRHGVKHYQARSDGAGSLLYKLYLAHRMENPLMAYTMEEFLRETKQALLQDLTAEERRAFLQQLQPEERGQFLRQLSPEERLQGLGPKERLQGLGPEERLQGLGPEERLQGLSKDELAQLIKDAQVRLN